MAANLIQYRCVASDHTATTQYPDKLTVHEGAWAFCPFDARATAHEWRKTGGVELQELMRRAGLAIVAPSSHDEAAPQPRATSAR